MKTNNVLRERDEFIAPDRQEFAKVFASFAAIVKTGLTTIYAQTRFLVAGVDAKIAVDAEHLFDMHVMYEPHLPHVLSRSVPLE